MKKPKTRKPKTHPRQPLRKTRRPNPLKALPPGLAKDLEEDAAVFSFGLMIAEVCRPIVRKLLNEPPTSVPTSEPTESR